MDARLDVVAVLHEHGRVIRELRRLIPEVEAIANRIVHALRLGGKVCWMGNGGSAADSQHLAAELVGRFARTRRGLASLALTTDTSILTAVGNDFGFELLFARQVEALCSSRDVVVGLSTSGNSSNVLHGLERAKDLGAFTVGMTGGTGGRMPLVADRCLIVPSEVTARIQEAHIVLGHILCEWIETAFAPHV